MNSGIIYIATSITTRKSYIGQSIKKLSERQYKHRYDALIVKSDQHFHQAIRKYGWKDFNWAILANNINKLELDDLEIKFIKHFNTFKNGYNSTSGGRYRLEISSSAKNKIKQANSGVNNPMYGRAHSDYSKNKMRAAKGKNHRVFQWKIIDPDNNVIIIKNLKKYCLEHGLHNGCMIAVSKNIRRHHKNYKCEKYIGENP